MKIPALLAMAGFSVLLAGCVAHPTEEAKFRSDMRNSMALVMDSLIVDAQANVDAKMKPIDQMFDPKVRDAAAGEAVPALAKLSTLLGQKADLINDKEARVQQINRLGVMVMLGEEDADKKLKAIAADKSDPELAVKAELSRLTGHLWRAHSEPAEQENVVKGLEQLAKANPKNDDIFRAIRDMTHYGAANDTIVQQMNLVIKNCCAGVDATAWNIRPKVGQQIQFKGVTDDGKPFDLDQYKGKVVVLDFWATWCPVCIGEMPAIIKMNAEQKDNGLVVIGILTADTAENLARFRVKNSYLTWPVIIREWDGLASEFGLADLPSKMIIGPDGRIVAMTEPLKPEQVMAIVEPLLKQIKDAPNK